MKDTRLNTCHKQRFQHWQIRECSRHNALHAVARKVPEEECIRDIALHVKNAAMVAHVHGSEAI